MAKTMTAAQFAANARRYIGQPYSKIDCAKLLNLASNGLITAEGSNTQWRKETADKGKISDGKPTDPYPDGNNRKSTDLQIGMAVFFHKAQDTKKYPDGQGDYSHVGIVTSVKPLLITNASSEKGEVTDYTKIGKWAAWAYMKDIDYGSQPEPEHKEEPTGMYQAKVVTKSAPLLVRKKPNGEKIGSVARGSVVNIYEAQDGWCRISQGSIEGWCSAQYLSALYDSPVMEAPAEEPVKQQTEYVTMEAFQALVDRVKRLEAEYDYGE